MSHAHVYINGQEAGYWPYGYNSFYVDATPYLKPGERIHWRFGLKTRTNLHVGIRVPDYIAMYIW